MRRLEDQRQVSKTVGIENSGMADGWPKSGPALAGPAAPATTALCCINQHSLAFQIPSASIEAYTGSFF